MGNLALAGYKFECVPPNIGYAKRYWRCYRPDGSKVTFQGGRTIWTDLKSLIENVVRWDGVALGIIEKVDIVEGGLRE